MYRTAKEAAEAALPGWRVKEEALVPASAVKADTGGESMAELAEMYEASGFAGEDSMSFEAAGGAEDHGPMELVVMEQVDPVTSRTRSKIVLVVDGEVVGMQD